MSKIGKIIKNNILGFVIGAILFGGIGIALAVQSNIASSDIAYTNSKNANVTSVKQAVDDLYGKVKDTEELSAKLDRYAAFVPQFIKSCDISNYLTCKVINQYKGNNVSYGVYYHNGTITPALAGIDTSDTTTILDAEDYSFRYAGAGGIINNYVCFGSSATTCPAGNLYRIIGAFTFDNGSTYQVKLIKSTQYKNEYWDLTGHNTWMGAWVRGKLNNTTSDGFLYTLGTNWKNLIYQATWKVGGASETEIEFEVYVKTSYTNEMASLGATNKPTSGDTDTNGAYIDNTGKIGLMYVSDYGYAATPQFWKTFLNNSYNTNDYSVTAKYYDWLWLRSDEWTITRLTRYSNMAAFVGSNGAVSAVTDLTRNFAIRPVFYLNSDVEVSAGTGTSSDPWRIKL